MREPAPEPQGERGHASGFPLLRTLLHRYAAPIRGRLRYIPWPRTPDGALTMAYYSCARYAGFHSILMRLPWKKPAKTCV